MTQATAHPSPMSRRVIGIAPAQPKARPQRCMPVDQQRSLAGRYPLWVKGLSLLAFTWAFLGWLNDAWFYQFDNSILLNRYTEYGLIVAFGIWRIAAEKNPYTRKRLMLLVANVAVLWWLIPWLFPFIEPYVGYLGVLPAFPSLHTPGTLTFFLVLAAVFLFGRRVICGWNCPCVGIREVVGFPFRQADHVPRGKWAWRLRHLKWLWFALYLGAMAAMVHPANNQTAGYLGFFALIVVLPYFATMLLSPWIGNRGYCRFLCPYGATFGLLNKAGAFRIDYAVDTCTQCGLCEKVCDMGIPVWQMGAATGKIDTTECMGCGRCVTECPTSSLAFHDVRTLLRPALRQDRAWLRRLADWTRPAPRWRAAGFALVLALALIGAWHYSGLIGSGAELISNLGALCGLPVSTW
ncbi:MAG: 4Fe-4S binding protein [Magnetococcales bacterium]|nr:4Fe-4S binding protein [Magnetococcales bacterium]